MVNRRGQGELERVFVEHDALLRDLVGRRVHSTEVVDDITSEVWIAATMAYRSGRASDVTTGWLITVAKRRLVDHWRRIGLDRRRTDRVAANLNRCTEASALESLLGSDESMLDLVTLTTATLLRLRYLEGHSVTDIADELGVSYRAAESRLARARHSLRCQVNCESASFRHRPLQMSS